MPGIHQKDIPPGRKFLSQTCSQQFNPIENFPNNKEFALNSGTNSCEINL